MKKAYLIQYKIVGNQGDFDDFADDYPTSILVRADDSSHAIFKLKTRLTKEGSIGKKTGMNLEIKSITEEIL